MARRGAKQSGYRHASNLPDDYGLDQQGRCACCSRRRKHWKMLKAGVLDAVCAQLRATIAGIINRRDALAALEKAKSLDPKDPLSHYYDTMMQQDALEPMAAIAAAREALLIYPYLKSLAPIANDKQGSANLGSAYALFGLESWARRTAMESQHPFFAGSYVFLAERTVEPYLRNSALVQGYLTDPTLFGASPKLSTLMRSPGGHASLEFNASRSPGIRPPSLDCGKWLCRFDTVAGTVRMPRSLRRLRLRRHGTEPGGSAGAAPDFAVGRVPVPRRVPPPHRAGKH